MQPTRSLPRFALSLATVILSVATGAAEGQANFRLSGTVTAPDETPVANATVRLYQASDPDRGPEPVSTDNSGEWSILGLESGRWEIEITAQGFLPSQGWVQVLQRNTPRLMVELRSLAERTPAFTEGSRVTVQTWLERANTLLEEGRTEEARTEYTKALGALPAAEHPQILQAVARTHFLENDYEAAIDALGEGLKIAPEDAALRQLFTLLLTELGLEAEIEQRLEELSNAPPSTAAASSVRSPTGPRIERPPVLQAPTAGQTGHFRTRFPEHSPLASMDEYLARYGHTREQIEEWDPEAGRYDLAHESFDVHVPAGAIAGEPLGVFVFVSPTPFGGFTKEEVREVLEERRLIWVGADDAGNRRASWYRINLALDAVHNLSQLYTIDPDRVYISGYSGGGRVASSMTLLYPEVFSGGLFFYGTDWYEARPVPFAPGATWAATFPRPARRQLKVLRENSRLAFLTGSRDFNRAETKITYRYAIDDGFVHASYLEIPEADHYFGIDGEWLDRGLEVLDRPLTSDRESSRPGGREGSSR